jgi:release factor glutamine methyltransferase
VAEATAPVKEALEGAIDSLTAAGVDNPRLDAELLVTEATGWSREKLATDPDARIPARSTRALSEMIRRRVRREPMAYILGRKGFRGLELEVDPRVLIPRPETELLVEIAIELSPATVVDVGTGSGAVALAVADELPDAEVTATDNSADALQVAMANANRLGLERVSFATGSLPTRGSFDLLLANLPYVGESEFEELEPEIREYEPRLALVPGPTGMEAIRSLTSKLGAATDIARTVALEIGAGQAEETAELLRGAGFERVEARPDLAGIDRVVLGHRPPEEDDAPPEGSAGTVGPKPPK